MVVQVLLAGSDAPVDPVWCPRPGIDLMDMASDVLQPVGEDTARISWNLRKKIAEYQETFSVLERVRPEEAPPPPRYTASTNL